MGSQAVYAHRCACAVMAKGGSRTRTVLLPLLLGVLCQYYGVNFKPVFMLCRNCFFPAKPGDVKPIHGNCSDAYLGEQVTIVVSVKDSCSQAPNFLTGLELFAPKNVHVIYTFPNFTVCNEIDIQPMVDRWDHFTVLPLPVRTSPMQGWVD